MENLAKLVRRVSVCMVLVAFAILLLPMSHLKAGDLSNCKITGVGVGDFNGWYLQCDGGTRTVNGTCGPSKPEQFAMRWDTTGSRETYTLALTLWLSGASVRVIGTGTCTIISGREDIRGLERQGM